MKKFYPAFFRLISVIAVVSFFSTESFAQTGCTWQTGDLTTHTQYGWDISTDWYSDYDVVYASTFGEVEIGIPGASGYSMFFTGPTRVTDYFVAAGTPASLSSDIINPVSSVTGTLGGEVLALQLNVDFSDSGKLGGTSNLIFGNLVLYNMTDASLNGLTVREILAIGNTLLGGGSSGYTIASIVGVLGELNGAFNGGTPTQWAIDHLLNPNCNHCPTITPSNVTTAPGTAINAVLQATDADNNTLTYSVSHQPVSGTVTLSNNTATYTPNAGFSGADQFIVSVSDGICSVNDTVNVTVECPTNTQWQQDEMLTYSQLDWGTPYTDAAILLGEHFGTFYGTGFEVGSIYTLVFGSPGAVYAYLPDVQTPGVLIGTEINPTQSSGGELAGQVMALQFNVDFSNANLLGGSFPLSELVFHDVTELPAVNGQTVAQVLSDANALLGGGTGSFSVSVTNSLVREINLAFLDGTASQFALDHLTISCETISANHCPTTTSSSAITPQGTSVSVMLQAIDEDNDALTYTITQSPTHGTATVTDSFATYIPTGLYYGNDYFVFTVSDGTCDVSDTVYISVVVCPHGFGYWKNNPSAWNAGWTPMTLGTVSYTKQQLINVLNKPVGNGNKADASLILAKQLIAAKLNILNGVVAPQTILDAITSSNTLIGSSPIPMNIKVSTALGQQMVALASLLEQFNSGAFTQGCNGLRLSDDESATESENGYAFENFPNPFTNVTTVRYQLPEQTFVTITVYNYLGQRVETLVNDVEGAGVKTLNFNADKLPSGVYTCRLQAGDYSATTRMVLMK